MISHGFNQKRRVYFPLLNPVLPGRSNMFKGPVPPDEETVDNSVTEPP